MKFSILNETKNRLRIHMAQSRMTMAQADILQYYLESLEGVTEVKVHDRTCDAIILYDGDRAVILDSLRQFGYDRVEVPADLTETSGRVMNRQYEDKLFWKTAWYMTKRWIVPMTFRYCLTSLKALKYIGKGFKCLADRKLEVPVLDATAITASILTKDFATAGSVMFMLEIGEILEEWTHKKSVGGLARSMSLNINKVWVRVDDCDVLMDSAKITKASPTLVRVVSFDGRDPDELLKIAACLEEHFPHSMARAVVAGAAAKGIEHEEMHSKVEYVVAHGISSSIEGKKVVIGSYHFVFEDEGCVIPEDKIELYESLSKAHSHLFMGIDGKLAAVISIKDPVRPESAEVVKRLKELGIGKVVMMTGDSERTAQAIAEQVGVDEYYSEVLPEDKAKFVEAEKAAGRKVIMVGDGINDSPALSASDAGIAVSDGAEIAREIADITVSADNLYELVTLKELSNRLMNRINRNYRKIVTFNTGLIILGVMGVIQPTTSALLHNSSTLLISMDSMKRLLD